MKEPPLMRLFLEAPLQERINLRAGEAFRRRVRAYMAQTRQVCRYSMTQLHQVLEAVSAPAWWKRVGL